MNHPMHMHRARSNGVSLKTRLATSQSVRTRNKGEIKITLPKPPWEKKPATPSQN